LVGSYPDQAPSTLHTIGRGAGRLHPDVNG